MRPGTIVTPGRNLPDPFVLRLHGGYELYVSQTGVNSEQLPTSFSSRFGGWTHFTSALPKAPLWAVRGFTWAPDVRRIEGVYVMYFNALAQKRLYFDPEARGLSARAQCIGAATARRAAGPFVARARPLICDFAGHGAIDPRTFVRRGRLYLDWKSDNNAGSPAPFPPTQLYAERLTADGLSLAGPPHLLLEADAAWQQEIVEAPDMIAWHGHYWLFYSGSWYNQPSYGIGVASCATPVGPCRDLSRLGPLIGSSEEGEGPGEESALAVAPGRWWLLYAPWFDGYAGRRRRPIAVTPLGIGVDGPRPDERG
ncbi:MAG: family 43 glycosylhydrolase [Acidimicrobiales bacterium]